VFKVWEITHFDGLSDKCHAKVLEDNDAAVVVFSFDARKHERADAGVESCVYFATGALTFGTLMISNLQILIIRECEARQLLYFPFGGNLLKGSSSGFT